MIVDDEEAVGYSVEQGLRYLGSSYNFYFANGGKKCLEFLNRNIKPDLILLDIMMPDMSGWEVYDKIKDNKKWSDIPVVFLTARTDAVAERAGEFLGEAYIEKPFEIEYLKNKIDVILNQ